MVDYYRIMDIPIDGVVQCTDGPGGHSTCVVLNPVTRRVSHVVVKQNTFPHLVRRGSHVRATDGDVGRVDEFLVDRETEHITHLVLREGHLWGGKDVLIPVSEIGQIDEEQVYLTLSKEEVANLPTIPVRRWHEGLGEE